VVILPVPLPLEPLVERLAAPAFGERFADTEAPDRRVYFALPVGEAADPARSPVVGAVPAEGVVHLTNEAEGEVPIGLFLRPVVEFDVVADRIRIGPEVAPRIGERGVKPCPAGKLRHEVANGRDTCVLVHLSLRGWVSEPAIRRPA